MSPTKADPGDERREEPVQDASEPEAGDFHEGVGDGTFATQCVEWCPICRTMDVLRASTTPEVREQWNGIQREALLTLRALVDHYIQRLGEEHGPEHRPGE
ncbi:MAG TPA: hypothetical protein VE401_02005, partial [Solirubrobacterales bacterium]|nr:hypothetical protein [Solirubrobacterales bacterium]